MAFEDSKPLPTLTWGTMIEYCGVGFFLCGSSGSGKSDLALRLLAKGARLIGDDQVYIHVDKGKLWASGPLDLNDKLEVRGVGIIDVKSLVKSLPQDKNAINQNNKRAPVSIEVILNLKPYDQIDRYPETPSSQMLGVTIPTYDFDPFERSWAEKLEAILSQIKK